MSPIRTGAATGSFGGRPFAAGGAGADAAAALVNFSAAALDEGQDQAAFCIASAKLLAGRNAISNGKECIQVHGAIGWTVECDAHHFLKRAHLYDQICGGVARQQALLMTLPAPLSRV